MSGTKRNHSPSNSKDQSSGGVGGGESSLKSSSSSHGSASPPSKKISPDGEEAATATGDNDDDTDINNVAVAPPSLSLSEKMTPSNGASNGDKMNGASSSSSSSSSNSNSNSNSSSNNNVANGDGKTNGTTNGETNGTTNGGGTDERTSKDYYFDSYSHHGIHEEMLKDEVRTKTYQMAMLDNRHLFEGKTILDVGCGTGILSMFAVKAGAKKVYAVDCSSIIEKTRRIITDNGMDDKITLIRGKVEEIELPVDRVDVIISEWMGYFLLYESMLNTVLIARDRWLDPVNGVVFPDKAVMYLCAAEDEHMKYERIDFWEDVYGFDMSALREVALREPIVDVVDPKSIATNSVAILNIDLQTCTESDLSFSSPFRLVSHRRDAVHSLVAYFECAFTRVSRPLGFSTSPFSKYTHWKQTIFYLDDPVRMEEGEELVGRISCVPNARNERDLDIAVEMSYEGRGGAHSKKMVNKRMEYRLR